jgi:class 3 adenylate cyclase/tetratricopeptide (TPR) repeat protein
MACANCKYDNPSDALFCEECGAKLEQSCPACGGANKPGAKFCKKCGERLAVSQTPVQARQQAVLPSAPVSTVRVTQSASDMADGERKTATALFADIKGSMELMEDLDPEEARAIVDPALRLMIDAVHRYDGYIVQSTGDGIFALFGAPVAHEDHPQRALYAALRMQEELRRYSTKLREGGNLAVEARVGANTGEVVVRSIRTDDAHTEYTPIGHSTGLAARMQALAPTGSIATTEQTPKLCEGYFTFKPLGPTTVKGVSEPVNVFEVIGLGPLRTRLQVSARRGLTRFVGRQSELEQMKHALELARQGHGQVVAAIGEPGVGKSRLIFEFKAIAQSGCLVLEAYSVSHGKASAYLPVVDLLKSYFKIAAEDDERARREKVAGKVVILDRTLEDTLPYLYSLLGIAETDDPLAPLDPQTRRRRTLEAIKRIAVRESLNQPLIVIFEDLHWIDSETQALLNLLVDGIATAPILLLVNYRPEYHHQWGNKTYYTQLRLDPLGRESADEMLGELLGDGAELAALKELIIERTEGNPFFMEEMVQALFEQGVLARDGAVKLAKQLEEIRVPPTVQAILASRIDRLAVAEKELLQTLAVLGREFSTGLLKRVVGGSNDQLERMLSALQLAEFIYEQPATGDIEYTFKHALTQEVAYNSMLTERRRLLHERAAREIEALFDGRLEDHLAELSHHYDRGGNIGKAVDYLSRAARRAVEQSAYSEAVARLTRALELVGQLPEGVDRARQELDLAITLAWSLYIARGPRVPEREQALLRARELSERLGDDRKLMEVELALALFRFNQRDFRAAQEMAERVAVLAQQVEAPVMLAGAHSVIGAVHATCGQIVEARPHLETAIEFFGPGPFHSFAELLYGQIAAGIRLMTLLMLGYPTTALEASAKLLAVARKLSDPVSLGYALLRNATIHASVRNSKTALQRADELLSLGSEDEMEWAHAAAVFYRGSALAAEGRLEEGIPQMRQGISKWDRSGGGTLPIVFTPLAEALRVQGSRAEGLAVVAEGLARAAATGARLAEPEMRRVKGELMLLSPPDEAEAERCFRTAIDIARTHGARWWELRTTVSLARLLKGRGRTAEAHNQLSEIYNWFTEGFEFADLKDAKALLDELGG